LFAGRTARLSALGPAAHVGNGVTTKRPTAYKTLSRPLEPHGNLRRLVADWHVIAPLG